MSLSKFVPPLFADWYRKIRYVKYGWFGDYPDWDAARNASSGYDSYSVLEKVKMSSLKIKNDEGAFERDSVLFDNIEYSYSLLSSLFYISSLNEGVLRVVDFGGSLGTTYFQNRALLRRLKTVSWSIVEQKIFVKCGKEYFEDDVVKFYDTLGVVDRRADVILMSCVLPYLETPYAKLEEIKGKYEFVILDRMPLIKSENDRLTVQVVNPKIYPLSCPSWFFSARKFHDYLNENYEIIFDYPCLDRANVSSEYRGFLLKFKNYSETH